MWVCTSTLTSSHKKPPLVPESVERREDINSGAKDAHELYARDRLRRNVQWMAGIAALDPPTLSEMGKLVEKVVEKVVDRLFEKVRQRPSRLRPHPPHTKTKNKKLEMGAWWTYLLDTRVVRSHIPSERIPSPAPTSCRLSLYVCAPVSRPH